MLLGKFMPVYHFNEVHSIVIHASPGCIFNFLYQLTPADITLVRPLFGIRSLPARLLGKQGLVFTEAEPFLKQMLGAGFILLAEKRNCEVVLGTIGQFWKLFEGTFPQIGDASDFLAFNQLNYAKATMNFYLEPCLDDSGVNVRTETRVYVPDPTTRKKFAAYWRLIYPGSALIRIMWLRALKRRAEAEPTALSQAKA